MISTQEFWPTVDYESPERYKMVDVFRIVFFLDREACSDPGPVVHAIDKFLSGLGTGHFGFYVDDDGYTVPLPQNYHPVLESRVVAPTQDDELAEVVLIEHEYQGPHYQLEYSYSPDRHERWPDEKTCLWMTIPQRDLLGPRLLEVTNFIKQLTEILPYSYGYASPALNYCEKFKLVHRYIHRHPGFDIVSPGAAAFDIGDRPLGAYWLNLFGPRLVASMGGTEALSEKLNPLATVEPCGQGGLCITLGLQPTVGDINRGHRLDNYRAFASILEPQLVVPKIKYFRDRDGGTSYEEQAEWHRRFLD